MSYCAKLTGEDFLCYLNKIESVGLRNADLTANAAKCYISLPYIMAARTVGIDIR